MNAIKPENRIFVTAEEEHVCIHGTWEGESFELYWDQAEWAEDPSLVLTIVEVVKLACWFPEEFVFRVHELKRGEGLVHH